MPKRIVAGVTALLLAGGLVYQLLGTGRYLYSKLYDKVWANRQLDAVVRSADGSFGAEFASFISFLRASIPDDSTVLLPPTQTTFFLNDRYLMQYSLFPRNLVTCQLDCADWLAEPGTFIIAQDDFPPSDLVPPSKRFISFDDALGLYVPVK